MKPEADDSKLTPAQLAKVSVSHFISYCVDNNRNIIGGS